MDANKIILNPLSIVRIFRILGIIAVLLVLASVAVSLVKHLTGHSSAYGLIPLFNVDAEGNIPTFFSTFLLLFAAALLGVITILKKKQMDSYSLYWTVLSFGLFYMAVDEASAIHEKLIYPIRVLLGNGKLGIFSFAWVIPFILIICVLALFFVRFLMHLPPKTKLTFLVAAILYIGGAIGLELIEGSYTEVHGLDFTYSMMTAIEESLEMAGIIIFNWALLVYFADNFKEVRIQVNAVRDEVPPAQRPKRGITNVIPSDHGNNEK